MTSVPPSLLATALLLQTYDKVSDAEAKARADFDIRWKVALGIEIEDRPFAKSTLQVFRGQLILHDQVREVFERSLRLARESGYLKRRSMRVALDTTYILGRGAVKDTYNLLADGMVRLLRALAAVDRTTVKAWAEAHGYERYLGSSVKGEAAIDWSSQRERRKLLAEVVADADRLLELARQAQGELPDDSAQRREIVEAAELLGQLLLQDVERKGSDGDGDGGVSLKEGVSRDRMMSVHDPEMRHGRKSSSKRFDGHKAAIVVDTDTQLITAVDVLPGNAPDNLGALELVEQSEASAGVAAVEAMGDAAYGDGGTRQAFADAGRQLVAKVPGRVPTGSISPSMTFTLTWWQAVAPVRRARSPTRLSPLGNVPTGWDASINRGPFNSTARCAEFVRCGRNALQPKAVRGGGCKSTRRKPCCNRRALCSGAPTMMSTAGYEWWRSTGWLGWSNWASGRRATSDGSRPSSSCIWRPRWPT